MNTNLVEIVNGTPVVSSRKIAEKFEKRHSDIISKIEGKIRPDGKVEVSLIEEIECAGKPAYHYFIENKFLNKQNGQEYKEYLITRDGFSLLVMGFTGQKALEWKIKYIEAFNKMESQIAQMNTKGNLLLSIYNGGQEAVVAAKELTKLEVEQATTPLLATIEEQRPAVEFTRHVTESSDSVDMNEFAKIIKKENIDIGRNRLFEWLREQGYLMQNNTPYQKYMSNGYFDVVEAVKNTAYGTRVFAKTLVKGKGQVAIVEKLRKEYSN